MSIYNPIGWKKLYDFVVAVPANHFDFNNIHAQSIQILCQGLIASLAGQFAVQVSVDNGATFLSGVNDYTTIPSTGIVVNTNTFGNTSGATIGPVDLLCQITGNNISSTKLSVFNGGNRAFINSKLPLNAFRILCSTGNITAGAIQIIGQQ